MGMDLVAIIEHNKTPKELLRIPQTLANANSVIDLFLNQHPHDTISQTKWRGPYKMTAENLIKIWEMEENDQEPHEIDGFNYDTDITSFFGSIRVNKHTINISPFPEHKYRNLSNPRSSKYVFTLYRQIAILFNTKKIIYCVDSYCESSILEEKSREGWKIEKIIELGNKLFGKPPKEINEAIANLYFIDEFDILLEQLDPQKRVWSRYEYEYQQKIKKNS